jgi:hypothetical protein
MPGSDHGQIASRRVDAERHVTPAHTGGRAQLHGGFLAFLGDHVHFVVKDLKIQVVYFTLGGLLVAGHGFGPKALNNLGIPAVRHITHGLPPGKLLQIFCKMLVW